MLKNFKLIIEYDGTDFCGWQRQKSDRTVQAVIEDALSVMTREQVTLIGSGRTDAGVHALGQTAGFSCETNLTPEVFMNGLNSLLPEDVVIRLCEQVSGDFHARYSAKSKTYVYRILNTQLPPAVGRQYAWHIRKELDIGAMRAAVEVIRGEHDFKAFEGAGSPRSSTVRNVTYAEFSVKDGGRIDFEIRANGFLRFMVRNIMGTLADVGLGKLAAADFREILLSRDRGNAGATAPPQGLFLMEVIY